VATYLARAAEKLRRQRQLCGCVTVFVRSSPFDGSSFYSNAATVSLATASNDTGVLLGAALPLVDTLFRPHKSLQKAGVLLQQLQSDSQLQPHLLAPLDPGQLQRRQALMAVVDGLNRRYGRATVQWAACGLAPRLGDAPRATLRCRHHLHPRHPHRSRRRAGAGTLQALCSSCTARSRRLSSSTSRSPAPTRPV